MQACTVPLALFMRSRRLASTKGVAFVDSTTLTVCQNPRTHQHQVFSGSAQRGKTSTGWFFGYKLHLVVNHQEEILSFCLTTGSTDDRQPVEQLTKSLWGKLFRDKGYISQNLQDKLKQKGIELVTKLRKNMKQEALPYFDHFMLCKRDLFESVNDIMEEHLPDPAHPPQKQKQLAGQSYFRIGGLLFFAL